MRSLETQVAGLSAHLAKPGAPLPDFVDISPRLKEIEKSIADSRETVMEAARSAAESAARSLAGNQSETQRGRRPCRRTQGAGNADAPLRRAQLQDFRGDPRHAAEDRRPHGFAGERGRAHEPARKLELKDAPPIDAEDAFPSIGGDPAPTTTVERTPAQAAAAAALAALGADHPVEPEQNNSRVRSMLGGLTRAFSKKDAPKEPELAGSPSPEPAMDAAPSVDLDMPLDPKLANRPLEPGSGAPDLNAIMKRVRDERSQPVRAGETDAGKSDFIAAARRAAQAAAAEADVNKRKSDVGSPVKALRIGDLLKSRRKPILMAATAIVTVLAGLQFGKTYRGRRPGNRRPRRNHARGACSLRAGRSGAVRSRAARQHAAGRRNPGRERRLPTDTVRAVDAPEELPLAASRSRKVSPA